METFFLACFLFGAGFTVVSALVGQLGHSFDLPDGGGHHPLFFFNFSALLAFLTWFGAMGYLVLTFLNWPLPVALLIGAVAGLGLGWIMAWFLRQIRAGDRVMDPDSYRLEGTLATVTVSIPDHAVGEIVFAKEGSRRSEAAKGLDGQAIAKGQEVVVVMVENGVALVQPIQAE